MTELPLGKQHEVILDAIESLGRDLAAARADMSGAVTNIGAALTEIARVTNDTAAKVAEIQSVQRSHVDEIVRAVDHVGQDVGEVGTAVGDVIEATDRIETFLYGEDETWATSDTLIPPEGFVLGVHAGGGSKASTIAAELGHPIQVSSIYWQSFKSPIGACQRLLDQGTVPRLELELIRALCNAGAKAQDDNGSIWLRMALGDYDAAILGLLVDVATLGRPIIVSWGHESDYKSEQGAHPKGSTEPEHSCGTPEEFKAAWIHVADLARQYAPNARLFLNLGGGYASACAPGGWWDRAWPGAEHVDFFGYDFYNWYGVGDPPSQDWSTFEEQVTKFGRWDWVQRTCPDVPIIIGEFGTCEGPGGAKDGGKWLLDAIDAIAERPQIKHAIYFSYDYRNQDGSGHTRQLDDGGQKQSVLPLIGKDDRLAWSA